MFSSSFFIPHLPARRLDAQLLCIESLIIVVSTPENLLRVAKEVKDIPQINVGNYGRIAPKHGTEARKTYTKNLYAYEDEVEVLRQVMATGIPCNVQTIPDDVPQELSKVLG